MDFDLSDDQLALRDGARDLLSALASPEAVRASFERNGGTDQALWSAMVEQGWLGVDVAEADGGIGLGMVELVVLLEEIGRHSAPVPFGPTVLALGALAREGESTWTSRLLAGEALGCVAWSRDPAAVTARRTGDSWTLHGRPDPVLFAPSADCAVVVAMIEGDGGEDGGAALGLFVVEVDAAGRPEREAMMDRTRELGWLVLDGVTATHLGGSDAVDALVDRGAVLACADMLGGASRALDMAVEYAKDRVQFDRPIGSFQAVKHRCADMLVDVEGMRSTTYWAAWSVGADAPDASVAASTAKIWCSDASKRVMGSALQVHGGIGFTWEHDLHFFLKRAQLDQMSFGDSVVHRIRLAELLRSRVLVGESVV